MEKKETGQAIGRSGRPIRVHFLNFRATHAEWQAIVERAQACGKLLGPFLRETLLRALGRARPNSADMFLLRELGRAGTALAGLAATARDTGALPAAATLEAALADLVAVTRRLALARRRRPPAP